MLTRTRRAGAILLVVAIATGAAACGSDDESGADATLALTDVAADTSTPSEAPDGTTASTESGEEGQGDAAAFPVTLEHKFGETVIESAPERVVVVGLTEQDALLALGVTPVGVTDWFGGHEYAVWPWAQDLLGDARPEVLNIDDGIQIERVAALDPDVIIGLYSGITDLEYEQLSQIAPTVAQPGEYVDWGIPWQEQTLAVGKIVGKADEAAALVADVEAQFATTREAHPEFDGASGIMATPYEGIYVYGPEDVRGRFMSDLGFIMPDELAALAGDEFGFEVSLEQYELLNTDVLVWLDVEDAGAAFGGGVYESMTVHQEGREVFLDSESEDSLGGATSFVTVLSLPFLLEGIVPMFAAAIDGDPATAVPASS
ncbi:MAG: iron-siderophore ABC transporter substrate-binding protein [Ilumatobacteraceae bacterium]